MFLCDGSRRRMPSWRIRSLRRWTRRAAVTVLRYALFLDAAAAISLIRKTSVIPQDDAP